MERIQALERSFLQLQLNRKDADDYHHKIEKEMEVSSPGRPLYPYRTLHKSRVPSNFQMPLQYPKYKKSDYEKMREGQLDKLLEAYGLSVTGCLEEKRQYAARAFLWQKECCK